MREKGNFHEIVTNRLFEARCLFVGPIEPNHSTNTFTFRIAERERKSKSVERCTSILKNNIKEKTPQKLTKSRSKKEKEYCDFLPSLPLLLHPLTSFFLA